MRLYSVVLFLAIGVVLAVSNGCSTGLTKTTGGTGTFSISVSPAQQSVTAGSTVTYVVTVTASNNFTGAVGLGVTGMPSGATGTFNPSSLQGGGTSTLTIATSSSTPAGTVAPKLSATSGSLSQS